MTPVNRFNDNDYRALAEFRYQIRRFLRYSEAAARAAGLEPQQHQLLIAVKGHPKDVPSSIGELAERLQVQHHSTVELVDRMVKRGYVQRRRDQNDRRQVLLYLTAKGDKILQELAQHHADELRLLGPALIASLKRKPAAPAKRPAAKKATRPARKAR